MNDKTIEQMAAWKGPHYAEVFAEFIDRYGKQVDDSSKRFGDASYAVEELIAELGSAYTMAHLELELTPRIDHAQYIESWLRVLKSDSKAIFTAASQAQKASDWLIARAEASTQRLAA